MASLPETMIAHLRPAILHPLLAAVILEKSKVALNSGHIYGAQWNQFARLNFATSPEIITQAITAAASSPSVRIGVNGCSRYSSGE